VYQAKEIAIFVHPDHRKTGVFKDMLAEMEKLLIENGVKVQHLAFQKGHNETMPLRFGYKPLEVVYEKVLEEEE
jgi:GNAT superfamily N-acetyltransferase